MAFRHPCRVSNLGDAGGLNEAILDRLYRNIVRRLRSRVETSAAFDHQKAIAVKRPNNVRISKRPRRLQFGDFARYAVFHIDAKKSPGVYVLT